MSTQNPNLKALSEAGVSIWLDDLNRPLITSGDLQVLIDTKAVVTAAKRSIKAAKGTD